MVWFHCEDCGDTIKKPKIVNHFRSCSASHFSCVDCLQTFSRATVNGHTTCVTEHEKYALAATKPGGFAAGGFPTHGEGGSSAAATSEPSGLEFLSTRPPWRCSVCNINCTSRETLVNHAVGAKHKRRARAALATNTVAGDAIGIAVNGDNVNGGRAVAGLGAPYTNGTGAKRKPAPITSSSDESSSSSDSESEQKSSKRQSIGAGPNPVLTSISRLTKVKPVSSSSSESDSSTSSSDSDSDNLPAKTSANTAGPAARTQSVGKAVAAEITSPSTSTSPDSSSDDESNDDSSEQDGEKWDRLVADVKRTLKHKAEMSHSEFLGLVCTHLYHGDKGVASEEMESCLERVRQQLVAQKVCGLRTETRLIMYEEPPKPTAKKPFKSVKKTKRIL